MVIRENSLLFRGVIGFLYEDGECLKLCGKMMRNAHLACSKAFDIQMSYGGSLGPIEEHAQQHGRAELLAVFKLDEASLIMAADRLYMTHTMKRILRVVGDS